MNADSDETPLVWFVPPITYRSADDTGRDLYYALALYFDTETEMAELLEHFR